MTIIQDYGQLFIEGTYYTVKLAFFAIIFSMPFAAGLALMRISKSRFLNSIARVYVEIIRGTPLLVQLYLVYFGLPMLIQTLNSKYGFTFSPTLMNDFTSAVLAITLNSIAYMSEIFRSGIQAVDVGQMEAARALGLSRRESYRKVIFPQAFRHIIPTIGNEFAVLIKETSIVSILGIHDLMFAAEMVRGALYVTFTPLLMAAAIYFILTFTISYLMNQLETKLSY